MEKIKVLLVEDNVFILQVICKQFDFIGWDIECAASYEEAATLVANNHYGLIITDIGLPDKSGIDLAAFVRQIEKEQNRQKAYVCGATAYALSDYQEASLEAGMDDLMAKPFAVDSLKQLLAVATKQYRNYLKE